MHIKIKEGYNNLITAELTEATITQEHIKKLEDTIDKLHEKTDDIHIVLLMGEHTKASLKAIYEGLKMVKKDRKIIHKIAVVGDSKLIKAGVALDNMVLPWEEKYFDLGDMDLAWKWITNE